MTKNITKYPAILCATILCIIASAFSISSKSALKNNTTPIITNILTDSISQIVSACPGEIGVAIIINNTDTVKVNNRSVYPMMSVFKLHQAIIE